MSDMDEFRSLVPPAEDEETEALVASIVGCFSNVSNLPEWMAVPALGRDTRPLLETAARAVLASGWLAAHDAQVRAEALAPIAGLVEEWDALLNPWDDDALELLDDLRAAMEAKG